MNWTTVQQAALVNAIQRRNERAVLERQLNQTKAEIDKRQKELAVLGEQWKAEQADVDRLHRLSWASVWYDLLNRKEDQISKEEAEAQQVRLHYDAVSATIDGLRKQQLNQESKLVEYGKANDEYEQLIGEKRIALSYAFDKAGKKYQDCVTELTNENQHLQELDEAQKAGVIAFNEVQLLIDLLNKARSWGTWDMLGGSTISSVVKYQKLDDVRDQSHQVMQRLAQFRTEYADVNQALQADWQFDNNLTRFVDIFFDNIFTDWSVQNRIHSAITSAQALENQLIKAVTSLNAQREQSTERTKQKADNLQRFLETV